MDRVITAQTDPQTARSYWTMSRGDSERAFRAARRHSRAVRIMRVAIPAAVVLMLTGFSLATYFNPFRALAKLPVNISDLVVSGTKITMEKPRMSGFTKDARAYEFNADAAAQDLTKAEIVELHNIRAKMQMQDQSMIDMSADTGIYDTKRDTPLEHNILTSSTAIKAAEPGDDRHPKGNIVRSARQCKFRRACQRQKLEVAIWRFRGGREYDADAQ